jgi:hypothetical protein
MVLNKKTIKFRLITRLNCQELNASDLKKQKLRAYIQIFPKTQVSPIRHP